MEFKQSNVAAELESGTWGWAVYCGHLQSVSTMSSDFNRSSRVSMIGVKQKGLN